MITNLIFDFGGVLFPVQPYKDKTALSPEQFRQLKQSVIDIYDEDKISFEYLHEKIQDQQIYRSLTEIDEKLLGVIKQLAKKYSVYALVNEAPKWTDIRRKLFNLDDYFKQIFVSSEIGYSKPDIKAYQYAIEQMRVAPSTCLFIDDDPKNVEAALSVEMSGLVYINSEQVSQYL